MIEVAVLVMTTYLLLVLNWLRRNRMYRQAVGVGFWNDHAFIGVADRGVSKNFALRRDAEFPRMGLGWSVLIPRLLAREARAIALWNRSFMFRSSNLCQYKRLLRSLKSKNKYRFYTYKVNCLDVTELNPKSNVLNKNYLHQSDCFFAAQYKWMRNFNRTTGCWWQCGGVHW